MNSKAYHAVFYLDLACCFIITHVSHHATSYNGIQRKLRLLSMVPPAVHNTFCVLSSPSFYQVQPKIKAETLDTS